MTGNTGGSTACIDKRVAEKYVAKCRYRLACLCRLSWFDDGVCFAFIVGGVGFVFFVFLLLIDFVYLFLIVCDCWLTLVERLLCGVRRSLTLKKKKNPIGF